MTAHAVPEVTASLSAAPAYHALAGYSLAGLFAAIKADLGIGEEQYGIAASQYKEYNGNYVKAQRQKWGDM